jgi:ribose transport system substrate-binding protein
MRNVARRFAAVGAAPLLLLCGCGGGRHESTEFYALVTSNTRIGYWQEADQGLRAAAKDLGVRVELVGPEKYDPQAEKEEFNRLVHRQIPPAGILVSAADPEVMRDAIDSAIAAGIPVITIDADSPKSKRLTFIGTNNYQVGQMGGEVLAKELNGKGTVVMYSIANQENIAERLEGYRRVLARYPGIKVEQVIDIAGDPNKAFDATKAMVEKGKGVPDAFVCLEALSCREVADVLDRGGVKGKVVIGMDTTEGTMTWMQKGAIRATIAQKPYTMAYFGVRLLDDLHHNKLPNMDAASAQGGRSLMPVFIDTGATLVDSSNFKSFIPASSSAQ